METRKLIEALRSDSCDGCPYSEECKTQVRGCILYFKAADMLELANAERKATFALGQMDMRQAAQSALMDAAAGELDLVAVVFQRAAAIVGALEVF